MLYYDILIVIIAMVCILYIYYILRQKDKQIKDLREYSPDVKLLQISKYSHTYRNLKEIIETSDLAQKFSKKNRLIRLSIFDRGKHVQECVVYKKKTIRIISKRYLLCFDITQKLTDQEYNQMVEWEQILQKQSIDGCTDGEPGLYQLVSVKGKEPMHVYGSMMVNEALKAGYGFKDFCGQLITNKLNNTPKDESRDTSKDGSKDTSNDGWQSYGFPTL